MDLIFKNCKLYLFWAVLGFCCCACFSLVVASRGPSLVAMCRLLIAVASLVLEQGLSGEWAQQLQLLGSRAQAQ